MQAAKGADVAAREISEVERAAVQLTVDYLSAGPEAVLGSLATTSRLKKLPVSQAVAEIEVRLGPPKGAAWKLQTIERSLSDSTAAFEVNFPSGIDEVVVMNFVKEGSRPRLSGFRILAEPVPADSEKKNVAATLAGTGFAAMAIVLMGVATPVARKKKGGGRRGSILTISMAVLLLTAAAGTWIFVKTGRSVSALIRLSSADEPSFAASNLSSRAISIPPGMQVRVSGDFLSIQSGP